MSMKLDTRRTKINYLHLFGVAKKNYYNDKLDKSKSDLKQTWQILNEVLSRSFTMTPYPANFSNNGEKKSVIMLTQPIVPVTISPT